MSFFRILVLADIHGNIRALNKLISILSKEETKIDLIIIAGDLPITTPIRLMSRFILTHASLSKRRYTEWVYKGLGRSKFVKKQLKSVNIILKSFKSLKAPIVYIPGNVDSFEAQELLKNWTDSEIYFLDSSEIILGQLRIKGIGGALHSFERSDTPLCDMEFEPHVFSNRITPIMESHVENTSLLDILVTHEPPSFIYHNSNMEIKGGSTSISNLISHIKPNLVIFGHYHEYPLVKQKRESTSYLCPGPLACYHYSLVEIHKSEIEISLKRMNAFIFDSINIIYSNRIHKNNVEKFFKFV